MTPAIEAQIEAALGADATAHAPARSNWRNTGKEFEREIETTAGAYQSRRQATLRKVDPPVRVFWKTDPATGERRQTVVFLENPFLDFAGAWTARGSRALFVEAKSTADGRLKFNGDSGFKRAQWTAMKSWRLAGAACALLWRRGGDQVRLWTPELLLAAEGRGDKSLAFEAGVPVPRGMGTVVWDFLPVLEGLIWPANKS